MIVNEINSQDEGALYGISADEVADVSHWEQLGILVRYVKDGKPVERFLQCVPCVKETGSAICEELVSTLKV